MDKLEEAKRVFNIEIEALEATRDALNSTFVHILDFITNCRFSGSRFTCYTNHNSFCWILNKSFRGFYSLIKGILSNTGFIQSSKVLFLTNECLLGH